MTIGLASGIFLSMESLRISMKIISFTSKVACMKKLQRKIWANSAHGNSSVGQSGLKQEVMSLKHLAYFLLSPTLIYRPSYPMRSQRNMSLVFRYSFICCTLFCITFKIFQNVSIPLRDVGVKSIPWKTVVRPNYWTFLAETMRQVMISLGFQEFWLNIFAELLKFGDRTFYSSWYRQHDLRRYTLRWNLVIQNWLFEYINQPVRRR